MKTTTLTSFLLLLAFSLPSHADQKLEQNVIIGKNLKANRFTQLYFSGQPSTNDFSILKSQGFTHIVNLRGKKEGDYKESQEATQVKKLGIRYHNIPYTGALSNDLIDEVTAAVVKHRKEGKTLIHCSSGNRVGMWLGAHFHRDHGKSKTEALEIAKKLGLNKPQAIAKVKKYLAKNQGK